MPKFSVKSHTRLMSCETDLIIVAKEVVKLYNIGIACGYRKQDEQDEAYNTGHSRVKWPNSKHNIYPSQALDFYFYDSFKGHAVWEEEIYREIWGAFNIVGFQKGIILRWGGNWDLDDDRDDQQFYDFGHIELVKPDGNEYERSTTELVRSFHA